MTGIVSAEVKKPLKGVRDIVPGWKKEETAPASAGKKSPAPAKPAAKVAKPARPSVELPAEEKAPAAVKAEKPKKSASGPTKDPSTFTFNKVTEKMHQILPDGSKVYIGKANDAREGSERHAAIAAAQACKTGADLKKIASNWVNWIKKNGYISFEPVDGK